MINLIIAQVFDSLIKRPEGSLPVMVVIDEMARLCSRGAIYGLHNQILLTGRSRNITLIMVTQSYEALSGAYSKDDIQSIVAIARMWSFLTVRVLKRQKAFAVW